MKLSRQRRRAVKRKYAAILNSGTEWAWDVAESADSLLQYLGKDAITATRYFWEPDRTRVSEHASILIMPNTISPPALFTVHCTAWLPEQAYREAV